MIGFWKNLAENKKPFFCLAPMSDVTDCAFRKILVRYGKPDVLWTEFISADGLCNKLARKNLSHILEYSHNEHPIVVQVFGANPENMKKACQYLGGFRFDGIDINMGCPDKSVISQGAGAAFIKTPELARKIIQAAKKGAPHLPISVKTRVGFNKEEIDSWIPELLKEDISALIIHARTKKEESLVPANWNYVKRIVEMVKKSGKDILVIGNGDVLGKEDGIEKAKISGCDGVMIGRAFLGNPWLLSPRINPYNVPIEKKLETLIEHIKLFEKMLGKVKNFDVMKKHFKAYVNDFEGAKKIRTKLMTAKNSKEAINIINSFLKKS